MRIEVTRVDHYVTSMSEDGFRIFIPEEFDYVVVNETYKFPTYDAPDVVKRFMKSPNVIKEEKEITFWEEYIYDYDEYNPPVVDFSQVHTIYKKEGKQDE